MRAFDGFELTLGAENSVIKFEKVLATGVRVHNKPDGRSGGRAGRGLTPSDGSPARCEDFRHFPLPAVNIPL